MTLTPTANVAEPGRADDQQQRRGGEHPECEPAEETRAPCAPCPHSDQACVGSSLRESKVESMLAQHEWEKACAE